MAVIAPNGGEVLAGGQSYLLGWSMSHGNDSILNAYVDLSTDDGASYPYRITSGNFSAGNVWYNWTVPSLDTTTARVRACAFGSDGNQSCDVSNGTFTIDSTAPYIVLTSPANGATNVALDALIMIEFSETMDTPTVSMVINPFVTLVPIWDPSYALLNLSHLPFQPCTVYTFTVLSGRDLAGNALVPGPVPNPWSWTTTCGNPSILSTIPANGEMNVTVNQSIVVAFSEAMDPASVTLTLNPNAGTMVPSWDSNYTTVAFAHSIPFASCTQYMARINGTSATGFPLGPGPVPNPWSFSTGCVNPTVVSTGPVDNETNVDAGRLIHVVFSKGMNTSSVSLVFLQGASVALNPTWSSGNTVVDFGHNTSFAACASYRVWVSGNDTGGNALTPGPVPNPWSFTTACTNPYIVYTNPAQGDPQTPRDAFVVVVFSKGMNATTVTVRFTPTVPNVLYSWTSPDVLSIAHDAFRPCRTYQVTVNGTDPLGQPLVPGPVPNPWTFTASCSTATVQLLSPLGGESWTGGSVHAVRFQVLNPIATPQLLKVNATYRSGAGSGTIGTQNVSVAALGTATAQINWTVPLIDAADVAVNLSATAAPAGDISGSGSGPFVIDSTPPQVVSANPSGPHAPQNPLVSVQFSEPVAWNATNVFAVSPPVAAAITWSPLGDGFTAQLSGTQPCTTYAASVGVAAPVRDRSDPGNPMAPHSWSFRTECLPSVTLRAPLGGQDWTGGSGHLIEYDASDADDPVLLGSLWYSTDNGATFPFLIAQDFAVRVGAGSYNWTVPRIDSAEVRVRIEVRDAAGDTAYDASPASLAVDSTPPSILTSFPANGGYGSKTTRQMWFVFSERVDRASFDFAFTVSPNPGGVTRTWSLSNLDTDMLTVDHDPLKSQTEYTVTFLTFAKDLSDPGNHPSSPLVVRFTTKPPPDVSPPVAKAVGKNQVQEGDVVTLDGSQSMGNLTSFVWRITDNQDRFVAALVGETVQIAFREHGRYHVTLFVTDTYGVQDDDTIEINVTSSPNGVVVLSGVILLSAALVASTEAGRAGLTSLFIVPLYVRRKRNEVLEHQTRGMILGYVMVHPGDSYTDIKRNLMLSNGTLSFHLRVLEQEGLLHAQFRGPRKVFFAKGVRIPEDGGGMHEIQVRIYRAIQSVPGLGVRDLAGALGISSQHALYHLRALAAQGFVHLERRGLNMRAYAEPGKGPTLHDETREES